MDFLLWSGGFLMLCVACLHNGPQGPRMIVLDKGSPLSSAGPSEIPVGTSTPAEPDAIQEIHTRSRVFRKSKDTP